MRKVREGLQSYKNKVILPDVRWGMYLSQYEQPVTLRINPFSKAPLIFMVFKWCLAITTFVRQLQNFLHRVDLQNFTVVLAASSLDPASV